MVCIIVDGYKFSRYYVQRIKARGYQCVHVQSTAHQVFQDTTYDASDYLANYIFDGDLSKLVSELKQLEIKCVFAGVESGVLLADLLADQLNVPHNPLNKSSARRDKYLMLEALRECNLTRPKYFKSDDYDDSIKWIQENTIWPVVAKPISSAASENVYICDSPLVLREAFDRIINKLSITGEENKEILIEEYLIGTEYVVNTVSCEGKHAVSDIWVNKKIVTKDHRIIYDTQRLLNTNGKTQTLLIDYVKSVLNALEIKYGAAHAEVMMTANGPVLIEIGARVGGHVWPEAHKHLLQHDQIELMLDAYLDPNSFFEKTRQHYQIKNQGLLVLLIANKTGMIESLPIINSLKKLKNFLNVRLIVKEKDRLVTTKDLTTSPGRVMLAGKNYNAILDDYKKIRLVEKEGYKLSTN